jgi:hypothetical protein
VDLLHEDASDVVGACDQVGAAPEGGAALMISAKTSSTNGFMVWFTA